MEQYIDLSLPLEEGLKGVEISPAKTLEKDGWNAQNISIYSHAGTHVDAPLHFGVSSLTIDQIPIEHFICDAWLINLDGIASKTEITVAHLGEIEQNVRAGQGIILRTGWSRFCKEARYRSELPFVGIEFAQWCVSRKVRLIGVEPPSVADVNNMKQLTEVHKELLAANIIIVEGLTNLDQIPVPFFRFMVLPLKIKDGDGAPARAIAMINS